MPCEMSGDIAPAKVRERTFRNPLKKFLELPTNSNDLACPRRFKYKVYEVPPNHDGHIAYAIDAPKKKLNVTPAVDRVADLLRGLPIKTFRDKMTNLLHDSDCYDAEQAKEECFEDCTRRDIATGREEYLKMFEKDRLLANGSSELMTTTLDYPLSAFKEVDVTVRARKETLFTPGWKEVSVFKSYGPGRFYLKEAKVTKNSFEDALTKWKESHELTDLEQFDCSSGYFIYYSETSNTFKGVHSLDYDEKHSVLDLDSGEIHHILDFSKEIRLMPDEIRDSLDPVVAARLTVDVTVEGYTQFFNSIAKTNKVYVTGCEDGLLLISPHARIKESSDFTHVFCDVNSCSGRCTSKPKSRRRSKIVQLNDN